MQGIILAAGMGKRLKNITKDKTKCMVEVNGISLIERMLKILDRNGLSRIIIVTGYQGEILKNYIASLAIHTPIVFVENPIYDKTNNIYSLSLTSSFLEEEDTLLMESDLIFDETVVDLIVNDPRKNLALVDRFESWMDGTCMILDENDCIVDMVAKKNLHFVNADQYYKTVNIYKFSRHFSKYTYVPFLKAYAMAMGNNEYYESVIRLIAMLDTKELQAKRLDGQRWYEIDDIQDLDIAESLFTNDTEEQYKKVTSRYGGFWRYPKLIDYCYLVNPYFPTEHMLEEIRANSDQLIMQYPSGTRVIRLLAGKLFGISDKKIIVGNGAAELIRELMQTADGKIGFVTPTFEEYINCCKQEQRVIMDTREMNFVYSIQDIKDYFEEKSIQMLVLINPDNPSGNYIDSQEIHELIHWCKEKKICFILDESFSDFSDEAETCISDSYLDLYNEFYVIKSISKSYGVPGCRLGVLAGKNSEKLEQIQRKLPIWNINSYAEFFLQIIEKYKEDYVLSLEHLKRSREIFMRNLETLPYIKVYPSQANYVMCELLDGVKSKELASFLLENNILIKVLNEKLKNQKEVIRLAVRTDTENEYLIELMKKFGGEDIE